MAGRKALRARPPRTDRGGQAGRGPDQAARAGRRSQPDGRAIVRADELRRSLLSAVSPRPAYAAGRRQGRGVQFARRRRRLLPRGHRRIAGHHRGIHRPAHRAGRKPTRFVASAAGVVHPDLRRVYLEETMQRALVSIGKGATGFYRSAIDRVKVDVGDAVVMADAGLLERVLCQPHRQRTAVRAQLHSSGQRGPGGRSRLDQCHRRRTRNPARGRRSGSSKPSSGRVITTTPLVGSGDVGRPWLRRSHGRAPLAAGDTPGGGLTVVVDLAAPQQIGSR